MIKFLLDNANGLMPTRITQILELLVGRELIRVIQNNL